MAAEKALIRARIRNARSEMSEQSRLHAREGFTTQLVALVESLGASRLSCFVPTATEPDVSGFLEWAKAAELDMLFPASRDDGYLDWISPSGSGHRSGKFGIREPLGELLPPGAVEHVDLMLVPAAAADLSGNRLGWGRGYFDRTLEALTHRPPVYAVIFDTEVFDAVPVEPHDAPVQGIVTPKRTLTFSA